MHVCMYVCMYVCIYIYIYIYDSFQTARTNEVIAEVTQFSIFNFHGNLWTNITTYCNMWRNITKRVNLRALKTSHIAKGRRVVALLRNRCLSRPVRKYYYQDCYCYHYYYYYHYYYH